MVTLPQANSSPAALSGPGAERWPGDSWLAVQPDAPALLSTQRASLPASRGDFSLECHFGLGHYLHSPTPASTIWSLISL